MRTLVLFLLLASFLLSFGFSQSCEEYCCNVFGDHYENYECYGLTDYSGYDSCVDSCYKALNGDYGDSGYGDYGDYGSASTCCLSSLALLGVVAGTWYFKN